FKNLHNEQSSESIKINLSKGQHTLISPQDAILAEKSWHFNPTKRGGHAVHQYREGDKRRYLFLHREVAQRMLERPLKDNERVINKNGNKLDNRRENIEIMTQSEQGRRAANIRHN